MNIAESVVKEARETGFVNFGGEYSFAITDNRDEACRKLEAVANQIGGSVEKMTGGVRVFPCYDPGYWAFYWMDYKEGVYRIAYWTGQHAHMKDNG